MVEQQPSKLMTRVRFPSPALEAVSKKDERRQTKFELTAGSLRLDPAAVAQLVERVLGKDEVIGSSPISSFVREAKQLWSQSRFENCKTKIHPFYDSLLLSVRN